MADEPEHSDGNDLESKLSDHRRFKQKLDPPFKQIPNLTFSSWADERMPEMLWAVLVVGGVERKSALELFRSVADFVYSHPECYSVELSSISKYSDANKTAFIRRVTSWSTDVRAALRPLALFPALPGIEQWKQFLEEPVPEDDWVKLSGAVYKSFWHQSDEATDCRWAKAICYLAAGKLHFTKDLEETEREIAGYPNYGDVEHARSFIRTTEIGTASSPEHNHSEWSEDFWQTCFNRTNCVPEEAFGHRIADRRHDFAASSTSCREHILKETADVRNQLISHFFSNCKSSQIDSRLEGSFGLALFGLTLFIEVNFFSTQFCISGRIGLRMLVETYITFKYLLTKEKTEIQLWQQYRSYGTGQLKLAYLKLKQSGDAVSSVELENLYALTNEDKWLEFVTVDLGHWNSVDLRTMSESVGLKDVYDKYFAYTSGFMHANWGAVRESVLQKCINPLHRFHKVPIYDLPLMSSVTFDAMDVANSILDCISEAYPTFEPRLSKPPSDEVEPDEAIVGQNP